MHLTLIAFFCTKYALVKISNLQLQVSMNYVSKQIIPNLQYEFYLCNSCNRHTRAIVLRRGSSDGCCEHYSELLDSTKGGELLQYLSDYRLFKKASAPYSWLWKQSYQKIYIFWYLICPRSLRPKCDNPNLMIFMYSFHDVQKWIYIGNNASECPFTCLNCWMVADEIWYWKAL
jgi:hypothetical protein